MLVHSDPNAPIVVERNDVFVIALESNPTTGYRWQVEFDSEMLALERQDFEPHGAGVGSGGVESFAFKALKSGETHTQLTLKRPWAQGEPPADTKTFMVRVL